MTSFLQFSHHGSNTDLIINHPSNMMSILIRGGHISMGKFQSGFLKKHIIFPPQVGEFSWDRAPPEVVIDAGDKQPGETNEGQQ